MAKSTANGQPERLVSGKLLADITHALNNIRGWGSVEVFVQNHKVVQITERNITKTEHPVSGKQAS